MYDYIIVGSGLYGAIFAHEAMKAGKSCLVVERRSHIGGNIYTKEMEGIQVHQYGAHIFHTSNKEVWDYIGQFATFNRYTNCPVAYYKGQMYNMPFNMNTFHKIWGVITPAEAKAKIEEQVKEYGVKEPKNLEEQAISLVGKDIYEILVKGYTEKQWGRRATELPPEIIKRLPVRLTYDNNYFNDLYQGIPVGGYTQIIEKMREGAKVRLNVDYLKEGETRVEMQKVLIRMLLSEDYRTTQDGSDITSMGFSQFNKYYNKAEGLKKYNYMTARIFHQAKAGKYDFHSSPFIQQLKEHFQELFHLFPEDYRSDYMDDLGDFIALYLDDYPVLQDHKQDLIDADFYDRITALTAVAFTWPSWENKKTAEDLSYFLLPEKTVPTEENPLQTQRIISYVKKENQKASDELAQAYTLYQEKNYAEAAAIFLQILSRKFADDTVLRGKGISTETSL